MSLKDKLRKWKKYKEEEEDGSLTTWKTEEDVKRKRRKLEIERHQNESLSIEHKEEMQVIFHNWKDLLVTSIPNSNNRNHPEILQNVDHIKIIK